MKIKIILTLYILLFLGTGCVTKFIPDITDKKNLLVVEGLITDSHKTYTVKLSVSETLGEKFSPSPLTGASVRITDNAGNTYLMTEKGAGHYLSDSLSFTGVRGRKYTLHVTAATDGVARNYESAPVELKAVPQIDSLYYEKVLIQEKDEFGHKVEGCQIYLDTHDNDENCMFYRWVYDETWEFHIPWEVPNNICWLSEPSYEISIKNTSVLSGNKISKFPLHFISNNSDRLSVKYSLLVSQYSISEDEYSYWEKLKNVTENVGGLYDVIPASITGNMFCTSNKTEPVLGYFSASGESVKRIFVKEYFSGLYKPYAQCIGDTITTYPIQGLGSYTWILYDHSFPPPPYTVVTYSKGCADCTVRGTKIKPDFWE